MPESVIGCDCIGRCDVWDCICSILPLVCDGWLTTRETKVLQMSSVQMLWGLGAERRTFDYDRYTAGRTAIASVAYANPNVWHVRMLHEGCSLYEVQLITHGYRHRDRYSCTGAGPGRN